MPDFHPSPAEFGRVQYKKVTLSLPRFPVAHVWVAYYGLFLGWMPGPVGMGTGQAQGPAPTRHRSQCHAWFYRLSRSPVGATPCGCPGRCYSHFVNLPPMVNFFRFHSCCFLNFRSIIQSFESCSNILSRLVAVAGQLSQSPILIYSHAGLGNLAFLNCLALRR